MKCLLMPVAFERRTSQPSSDRDRAYSLGSEGISALATGLPSRVAVYVEFQHACIVQILGPLGFRNAD